MQVKIHLKDKDFELTVEGDKKTVASVFWGTLERWFPALDEPVKIIEEGGVIEKALGRREKPKPARVKKAAAKPKPIRVDGEYSIVEKADGTTYKRLKRRWFKKPKDADKSAALAPAPAAVPVPKKKVPAAPAKSKARAEEAPREREAFEKTCEEKTCQRTTPLRYPCLQCGQQVCQDCYVATKKSCTTCAVNER